MSFPIFVLNNIFKVDGSIDILFHVLDFIEIVNGIHQASVLAFVVRLHRFEHFDEL